MDFYIMNRKAYLKLHIFYLKYKQFCNRLELWTLDQRERFLIWLGRFFGETTK